MKEFQYQLSALVESARGLAHSKTLSRVSSPRKWRQLLDCASTLALSTRSAFQASNIVLAFLLLSIFLCHAENISTAFSEANHLYEQQKFTDAAAAYEKIIAGGTVSPSLYFNLGNARFKAGQIGRAIAAYRQAEKLSPRDPNVKANLQFARDQVPNTKPPATSFWMQILDRLTLNEWTSIAAIFFWLWFLLLAFGQWKPDWRKTLRGYAIALGIVSALLIGCTIFAAERHSNKAAVVVTQEAVVRRGPFDESQSAFALRDGAELTVLDKKENWLQVADTSNRIGWVAENQIALIQ